jgi:hypothetical protein
MGKTIDAKIVDIQSEPNATILNTSIRPKIQNLILEIVKLESWKEFAKEFIDSENSEALQKAQLDRLTLADDLSEDTYIRQSVAYLFANGVCTGTTRARLNENINGILDNDIDLDQ